MLSVADNRSGIHWEWSMRAATDRMVASGLSQPVSLQELSPRAGPAHATVRVPSLPGPLWLPEASLGMERSGLRVLNLSALAAE